MFLTIHWSQTLSFPKAVYTSVFHSVSAFCNAGFSLFSDSLILDSGNMLLVFTICALIVVGGIGFPVLYDLQYWFRRRKTQRIKLALQTKTVLVTTFFLIVIGTVMFALLEEHPLQTGDSLVHRILIALFQSITCRTAGFNTIDIASLREATLALMIFLMFIGASPGSCGGGVKTTTLALLGAFTISKMKGRIRVNMFRKSIPVEAVNRSISLILVSICVIGIILFLLLVSESSGPNISGNSGSFLSYLFETVSAFGTVGLSMGVTAYLGILGKIWLTVMMIIGRVGVLTFSYIIVGTGATSGIEYSEESIMIG